MSHGTTSSSNISKHVLHLLLSTPRWRFVRRILHANGSGARVNGNATWTLLHTHTPTASPTATTVSQVLYEERGEMTLDGSDARNGVLDVQQRYLWTQDHGDGRSDTDINIYFYESGQRGALFQSLRFESSQSNGNAGGGLQATAKHWCAPDTYHSTYSLTADHQIFTVQHSVVGPTKDYVSTTEYAREVYL